MSMPVRVTILSREDCHLCGVVYRIAMHLQSELHIETSKVYIDGDSVLTERYGARVPVVLLDEVEHFTGKVTEGELRRAIKRARWRRPISRILSRLGYAPTRGRSFLWDSSYLEPQATYPKTSAGPAGRRLSEESRQMSSYLALHRATLTLPVMSPPPRWALTPPFHPYLSQGDQIGIPSLWPSAVCSLWCWCRIAPPGSYPAPCP